MCEPTLILAGASTLFAAKGAYDQAAMQKQVAGNNAVLAERAAADAITRGDKDAMAVRRQASLLIGSQRASLASRGVDLGEGTAAELQDQADFFSQSDQATARTNARKEASGYGSQAAVFNAQARSINPGLIAGSTLLAGASGVADKWYGYGYNANGSPGDGLSQGARRRIGVS